MRSIAVRENKKTGVWLAERLRLNRPAGYALVRAAEDLARLIDHTLLRADATYAEIDKLCDEAIKYGFASVCVNPAHVRRCAQKLRGAQPVVCTVVGFPLGATPSEVKALEARRAIRDGAREIDMVIAIGALKSGDYCYVFDDILAKSSGWLAPRAPAKPPCSSASVRSSSRPPGECPWAMK